MSGRFDVKYAIRKNEGNQYWTVYDVSTGLPVAVNDIILDRCKRDEASDIAELMNADHTERPSKTQRI